MKRTPLDKDGENPNVERSIYLVNKATDFTEDDDKFLTRYHRGGLSLQEMSQRLKRKPNLIADRLSNLDLATEDHSAKVETNFKLKGNEFSQILVILSAIVFIFSLIFIYPNRFPSIQFEGFFLAALKVIIVLSIPVGFYEWGRSITELFKPNPVTLQAVPREKWTVKNECLLKILADEGHSLKLISLRLGFAQDERYTEGSVRSKLVQLNFYNRYIEKHYIGYARQVKYLAKKLGKDIKTLESNHNGIGLEEETASIIRHFDEKKVEVRQTFFLNPQSGRKSPEATQQCISIICGFLNSIGGTLIIGVKEDPITGKAKVVGIFDDDFSGSQAYIGSISQSLKKFIPVWSFKYLSMSIIKLRGSEDVCVIRVKTSNKPVFCKYRYENNKKIDEKTFFIRSSGISIKLDEDKYWNYISEHFSEEN